MTNQFLVLNTATFVFTSPQLADFTEADISTTAVFGFGTGPDSIIAVPEPAAFSRAAAGLGLAWLARRRLGGMAPALTARIVFAAAAATLLVAQRPVVAQNFPVVLIDNEYDFAKGPEG